jgi:hypothetical protein
MRPVRPLLPRRRDDYAGRHQLDAQLAGLDE